MLEIWLFSVKMRRYKRIGYVENVENAHRSVAQGWQRMDGNLYFYSYPKNHKGEFVNISC